MAQIVADSAPAGVHGFAKVLTTFVGRAAETTELGGLLRPYRLVTVTGPGGVSKSRLAREVAIRAADQYTDGVWMVELASVQDPAHVPGAIVTALENTFYRLWLRSAVIY